MQITSSVTTRAHWWAWAVAAATLAVQLWLAATLAVHADAVPELGFFASSPAFVVGQGLLIALIPALGGVVLRRRPRHPIGWIMVAAGATVVVDALARLYAVHGLYVRPDGLPGAAWAAWLADWNWFPGMVGLLVFLPLLFPDGRLPGPRWRPVGIGLVVWLGVSTLGYAFTPEPLSDFTGVERPFSTPLAYAGGVGMLLTPVALGIGLAAVVVRRRRAVGDQREQLRWLLYAMAMVVVCWTAMMVTGALGLGSAAVGLALSQGSLALVPVAITVAITKYRLYDIDRLINRTLVYGGLTATVLLAYALVVLLVSAATPTSLEWRGSVLVVAGVAILAYPLREALQRVVDRLMYGDRDSPARAMSRLARRVADSVSPTALLPAAVETIGQALRLPYVAVRLAGDTGAPIASYGTLRGPPHRIALVHQGEPVGTLLLGRRSAAEQFTPADLRVLDDVAHQVAVAAHAVRLSADLQRSRERLVQAREEERRRVRRDLHDGVGSALAGLALHAGNARRSLPGSPGEAERWVSGLEAGIQEVLVDIRRIVDDLRPPALDELGLVGALRERAEALVPGSTVEADLAGADLPAAVEVAAYRIGTEALTNAARHSGATGVTLRIVVAEHRLLVEVEDDGTGIRPGSPTGVGLGSMRERADEVGGRCEVTPAPGGGTLVTAVLPWPREEP